MTALRILSVFEALHILLARNPLWAGSLEKELVSHDPRVQAIDRVLRESEREGLCGTILLRSGNRVLLHKAYGFADRENRRAMRTSTGYLIGSLVKPIAAATIFKLEGLGHLRTTDTLARYFPQVPEDKADITLMQLLTHTSGMPDIFGGDYVPASRDWLVKTALKARLISKPGAEKNYSNSGYSLLAVIMENVTRASFESVVREQVFLPAAVTKTGYVIPGWENSDLAVGYGQNGVRWGTPLDQSWGADGPYWNLRGNGGMLGTPEETCRWYEALFDGEILGPVALGNFLAIMSGESRAVGGRALAQAGGNRIFNSFQLSYIDADFHMTFFTSTADFRAEAEWRKFRDEIIGLAKEALAAHQQKTQRD